VPFILATVISFTLGWIFWKFIEKPSAELSNKVKYGNKKATVDRHKVVSEQ
jgi:peptidoglycan/LPS O-acetylase OafA/YrhL